MSHKTLIAGTAREVTGGKTLIAGTGRELSGGKTLIGGTGYNIEFAPAPLVLYTAGNNSVAHGAMGYMMYAFGEDSYGPYVLSYYCGPNVAGASDCYTFGSQYLLLKNRSTMSYSQGGAIQLSGLDFATYSKLSISCNGAVYIRQSSLDEWDAEYLEDFSEPEYTPSNGVVNFTLSTRSYDYLYIWGYGVNITKITLT